VCSDKERLKDLNRQIVAVEKRVEDVKRAAAIDRSAEEAQRTARLKELKSETDKVRAKLTADRKELERVKAAEASWNDRKDAVDRAVRDIMAQRGQAKTAVQRLHERIENGMRTFGSKVPEINKDIDAAMSAGKFGVRPIGPVGNFIKLKPAAMSGGWTRGVEAVLSNVLNTYVCDSYRDMMELKTIFARHKDCKPAPQVVVQRRQTEHYDLREFQRPIEVRGGGGGGGGAGDKKEVLQTAYSLLDVADPWAHNVTVDQTGCERWLLCDNHDRGTRHGSRPARRVFSLPTRSV
jgi:hypothetical protein